MRSPASRATRSLAHLSQAALDQSCRPLIGGERATPSPALGGDKSPVPVAERTALGAAEDPLGELKAGLVPLARGMAIEAVYGRNVRA